MKITITINEEVYKASKETQKRLLGKENFSGLVSYLVNRENEMTKSQRGVSYLPNLETDE